MLWLVLGRWLQGALASHTQNANPASFPINLLSLPSPPPKKHPKHPLDSHLLQKTQINKYAFSGGGATLEEHRAKGANLDVDVPWKYLNFFMEDDTKLAHIGREYGAGRMLTGGLRGWVGGRGVCWVCVNVLLRLEQQVVSLRVNLIVGVGERLTHGATRCCCIL